MKTSTACLFLWPLLLLWLLTLSKTAVWMFVWMLDRVDLDLLLWWSGATAISSAALFGTLSLFKRLERAGILHD